MSLCNMLSGHYQLPVPQLAAGPAVHREIARPDQFPVLKRRSPFWQIRAGYSLISI